MPQEQTLSAGLPGRSLSPILAPLLTIALAFFSGPSCALVPESSVSRLAPDNPAMADGLSDEVMADLLGIGIVVESGATATYPAGLYAISSTGTFTRVSLAADSDDESSITVEALYDLPAAYMLRMDGLYAVGNDPGAGCATMMIRKEDGKFFCLDYQLELGTDSSLPRPVLSSPSGSSIYLGGYWTDEHTMSINSFAIPAVEEASTGSSDLPLETVYPGLGEFALNSEGDVLHSGALDTTPAVRVVLAGGTVASIADETAYCTFSGGGTDSPNFYWYTGELGSLSLRKGTRNPTTGAFSVATQSITLPDTSSVYTPAAFGGDDGLEPCSEGQVFSSDNASYIIGTYVVTDNVAIPPTVTETHRLLQMTSTGASVKAALSTANVTTLNRGLTSGSSLFLQVTYADSSVGLVVLNDLNPASVTEVEWIPGGTYTFDAWRPSSEGKFYFSGTKVASSEKVFAIKESAAGAISELSVTAPTFSAIGLQPVATP